METFIDDDGNVCCDNCSEPLDDCACVCQECGDYPQDCACDEGPTYLAVAN